MAREMKYSGISWIGDVPEEWMVVPALYAFSEIKSKNTDGRITKALKFFNGTIIPKSNFDAESDEYVADTITSYTIVEPNTIMINGLNLNYDLKSLRVGLVKETGVITSAYLALRPDAEKILPRFATYLFKGYEAKMAFHNMGAGIRKTLGFKEFRRQPIIVPSICEQTRIVDYLDAECARIDAVIEQTRASIEEYKKLKQSAITEAVTKGIRKNRQMKDSGIEWIGEIPEEWEVIGLRFLCGMQAGKNLASESIAPEGQYPVYGGNGVRGYYSEYNTEGDYLLVGRQGALCGNVHRVSGRFWSTEHAVITTPTAFSEIGFLYYLLVGMNLNQYVNNTAAQPGLTVNQIQGVKTCLVPLQEQRKIAQHLDKKCAEIDGLIKRKEQLVSELETHKKSLIFEYVTGKKEV
ncbi:MAG: restriction endonuclease subunit S [Clostridia bacterium]|nr:restriction endonuclease subunit S [Clostridia bacterium]